MYKRRLAGSATRRLVRRRIAGKFTRTAARRAAFVNPYAAAGALAVGAAGYGIYRRRRAIRRRNKRTARIGYHPSKRAPVKARQVDASSYVITKLSANLHSAEITTIAKGSTYQTRERDWINLKGFRINKFFKNVTTSCIVVNCAVLATKVHDDKVSIPDNGTELKEEFFRDETDPTRSTNWIEVGLTYQELAYNRINPDRWSIVKRWRRTLAGTDETDCRKQEWKINKYVPINRQLHYDDNNDKPETGRMFLVWWFTPTTKTTAASGITIGHSTQVRAYWTDTFAHRY